MERREVTHTHEEEYKRKENFIPEAYNSKSTLKISVSDLSDKNKVDFHLGETPTADSH